MIACGEKKRPGGKLVKVCLRVEGGTVRGVLLTGDFFAEPEEAFEELASRLAGLEAGVDEAPRAIVEAVEASGVKLHGVGVGEVLEAVKRALVGAASRTGR